MEQQKQVLLPISVMENGCIVCKMEGIGHHPVIPICTIHGKGVDGLSFIGYQFEKGGVVFQRVIGWTDGVVTSGNSFPGSHPIPAKFAVFQKLTNQKESN